MHCPGCADSIRDLTPGAPWERPGRPAIREMLDFAARHAVAAKVEPRRLKDADAALDHVRHGKARYRVVLAA